MTDELAARFFEAIFYAMRECLNGEIDHRHDGLIRQAIEYFEGDEFPADYGLRNTEMLALAQAAKRRREA